MTTCDYILWCLIGYKLFEDWIYEIIYNKYLKTNTQGKMLIFECILVLIKSLRNDKHNFKCIHTITLSYLSLVMLCYK